MIIKIEDTDDFYNKIITSLKNNSVVAMPTDTVYGFAVDGSAFKAVKRLAAIKGRNEKPFTFFLAKRKIAEYAVVTKRRIIDYFVPGPLTIILKKRTGISLPFVSAKIGIRIPRVDFIVKLLHLWEKPLAVTSANLSGQAPLTSALEIAERFIDIDLVIDGGILVSQPSTVVDLTTTPPTVKRKGAIPILEIEKVFGQNVKMDSALKFNVLFVCSGNTCRSPMAEGILKTLISERYCEVKSAGTLPMEGMPPSENAQRVVEEYGGSRTHHVSQTITKELIGWADVVLTMEYKHYTTVLAIAPNSALKTFLMKEYKRRTKYSKVYDPIGKDIHVYRKTAKEMLPSLQLIASDIKRRFTGVKE